MELVGSSGRTVSRSFCAPSRGTDAHPSLPRARPSIASRPRGRIVARICRVLADRSVNIADLQSQTLPSPSGGAIYRMSILAEVPDRLDAAELEKALDEAGQSIGVEVRLATA
jgi:glycine cleavage system regulatory protein